MACLQWHPGTSKDIQQEANLGDMAFQNIPHFLGDPNPAFIIPPGASLALPVCTWA